MCGTPSRSRAVVLTFLAIAPQWRCQGAVAFCPRYAATEWVAISPIVLSGGLINDGGLIFAGFIVFR